VVANSDAVVHFVGSSVFNSLMKRDLHQFYQIIKNVLKYV